MPNTTEIPFETMFLNKSGNLVKLIFAYCRYLGVFAWIPGNQNQVWPFMIWPSENFIQKFHWAGCVGKGSQA